ncbi:amidohydrolase family protein [Rhodococcus rhodochrous]|uniref:amidohydrolase family protein n=1 Tax=Rhodococcus rhodochrous TaxID=1829 RepID=UPI001E58ED24|nr:amidohydrolase family protein [Rhodococcus rhodochrous]MCD2099509.1 amidohydrolase family protein [Rhodococcus rhodochrous]MCD2123804.1 amidohydrolase family protein [Rhodococcus rhodochrous]MCQ4136484.1 amidohydrolase family protein [Rhodococcus rhodochrous]MDJ0020750.1 amidohydrolase family protein [Rhodococcus rhodochrous]
MKTTLADFTAAHDNGRPILLTGGAVVTMDPSIPDLDAGDVLLVGSQIIAIGADLRSDLEHGAAAASALVVDTRGAIVGPGFVDTHRHAWEAQLRRSIPDVSDLGEYVMSTLAGVAPKYAPEDMYIGTRLAALTALDSGITTMLDFSHNSRSSAHSDAALNALIDTGIRGVHASMGPHFGEWDRQWPKDMSRLVSDFHNAADGLVTVRLAALATDEIAGPAIAYGPELAAFARDLGVWTSIDAVFGVPSSEAILRWARMGILDPTLTLIHATGLTPEAWAAMGDAGVTVSLAPTSDAQIGLESAVPAVDEALAVGIRPGLSIDVEVALASDMFTQMRTLHAIQRMRATNAAYGTEETRNRITTRDVLDFATLRGAQANALGHVTGSLTPGKEADLLIVRADDINNMPLNDAVGTLVLGSDARNIDTVLVAGNPRKWAGSLVDEDIDALREAVIRSRNAIIGRVAATL